MVYTALNGKPIAEVPFDELVRHFEQHVFFKFMDSGRKGIELAAMDVIDNFMIQLKAVSDDKKIKNCLTHKIPADTIQKLEGFVQRELINGFIREGTQGIRSALMTSHTVIANVMAGSKLG